MPRSPQFFPELAAAIARVDIRHAELAGRAGCAAGTIVHILRGRVRPSAALKERIAAALDANVEDLFVLSPDVQRLVALAIEQGLPPHITDPTVVARVAALAGGDVNAPAA